MVLVREAVADDWCVLRDIRLAKGVSGTDRGYQYGADGRRLALPMTPETSAPKIAC